LGIENPEKTTWKDIDAKREEQAETSRQEYSQRLFGHQNATWQQISGEEDRRSQVGDTVQEAVKLTPVVVKGYQIPLEVGEGFPEILRTDKERTISLHPDDVEIFKKIREKI